MLYIIGIRIISCIIFVASPFNHKLKLWREGRKKIFGRLEKEVNPEEKTIWFHCASLGEFEQGRPVIEAIREKAPGLKILLTFFSPSGYEIRKNFPGADYIYYLPLDTRQNAEKFITLVNPAFAVFVKYEFWYFFIRTLNRRHIPVYLISANFRNNQIFFRRYGGFFRGILAMFTHLFIQNQKSKELLSTIGIDAVSVAGDTRFDRVHAISNRRKRLKPVEQFKQNELTVVAGSTWKEDEEHIIRYINEQKNNLRWIIAPHEIREENILRILNSLTRPSVRYSELNHSNTSGAEILVVDNIGLLSSLYYYGEIAYIGGGFGKGIHNILEAATYGMPVLFGPNYKNFQEALDLVERKGAFPVRSYKDVVNTIHQLITEPEYLKKTGNIAKEFVKSNLGATRLIVEKLLID
ncbi:MAG: 3-deoxy-D-manno-octulosonic acid transferase [Bacteroidales bacterium]|nr:MAG: 3-deoxy-D-manno-octulosonic acid transferase [Bacteroidales bacterium]